MRRDEPGIGTGRNGVTIVGTGREHMSQRILAPRSRQCMHGSAILHEIQPLVAGMMSLTVP